VIVINKRDPKTKYQLFMIAKSRDDDALGVNDVVKLGGDVVAFQDFSDQYKLEGKRFKRVGMKAAAAKVPTEQKAYSGEEIE
jgi:hypothetical protein